jgi:hypothetical protein
LVVYKTPLQLKKKKEENKIRKKLERPKKKKPTV